MQVFEHVSVALGDAFAEVINTKYGYLDLNKFTVNDKIGGSLDRVDVDGVIISPTTLRYVKILGDLIEAGLTTGMRVAEIGGGCGGQCLVISQQLELDYYAIFDLQDALSLQQRYLSQFGVFPDLMPAPEAESKERNSLLYDWCVSNYAFSECTRNSQDWYIENVFRAANHGYVLCNFISERYGVSSYSLGELLRRIPGSWAEAEYPGTSPDNVLLRW